QALGVFGALVDGAAVGPLALEHAACIVQAMGEHADLGFRRGQELAVEPDQVRALVEWHRHGMSSCQEPPLEPHFCGLLPLLRQASSPDILRPNHQSAFPGAVKRGPPEAVLPVRSFRGGASLGNNKTEICQYG